MTKRLFVQLLILGIIPLTSFSQQKIIDVTYIANAGFLIKTDDKQLIIDGLFKPILPDYVAPHDSIVTKIISSQEPFEKSHLMLITHNHSDHFSDSLVVDYLNFNPYNVLIAPSLVVNAILEHPNCEDCKSQIIELSSDNKYRKDTIIQGIRLKSFFLQHGKNPDIENVGYFITMNGVNLFHSGDCQGVNKLQIENLHLNDENIDIAFLGTFWLNDEERNMAIDKITPRNIIFMHSPIKYHEQIKKGVYDINKLTDNVELILFDKSMERKSFILD